MRNYFKFIFIVTILLFHIGCDGGDKKVYISSADLMTRNLDNRVEVACPIYQEDLKKQITYILLYNLV